MLFRSFMKESGVDLSVPNKFWSKYAPIRNQLIRESKPFNPVETSTKTFARTLENVAKGKDVNNENFVTAIEKLLGRSLTKDLRTIVVKMDKAQKTATAAKIQKDITKMETKMVKDAALQSLDLKKLAVQRQARIRDIIKKAIETVIGLVVVNKIAKKVFGVGF